MILVIKSSKEQPRDKKGRFAKKRDYDLKKVSTAMNAILLTRTNRAEKAKLRRRKSKLAKLEKTISSLENKKKKSSLSDKENATYTKAKRDRQRTRKEIKPLETRVKFGAKQAKQYRELARDDEGVRIDNKGRIISGNAKGMKSLAEEMDKLKSIGIEFPW